eukprot:TRINITY_DN6721_c0_g1_i4.p1 TRINITY_DN6721_c0_g1~~TRINITY_DN6721_c0_g1_i4.p1  ORF type:complete len:186 (+),score=18.97 TRINITY_DN6721_c0_g1_i4:3-560(+)
MAQVVGHQSWKRVGFDFSGAVNWFPGHMAKASRLIQSTLKTVDAVLEIRDARVPFSSRNEHLERILHNRHLPHVVVLHKADLANASMQSTVLAKLRQQGKEPIFTSSAPGSTKGQSVKRIIPITLSVISKAKATTSGFNPTRRQLTFMVLGIPNVGKSTIINSLRAAHAATTNDFRKGTALITSI